MIQAVGFDLDNTLYDQSQFMLSFFANVSAWLAQELRVPQEKAYGALYQVWRMRTSYYPSLFQDTLTLLGAPENQYVGTLVKKYHEHKTLLTLFPGVADLLGELMPRVPLFLITDGYGDMQRGKVASLGIAGFFQSIVYTHDYGSDWRKPSVLPFQYIAKEINLPAQVCMYVGDNPLCDFKGGMLAGMQTMRVLTGEFSTMESRPEALPNYTIASLNELLPLIKNT